jgi:hypothetical protein
LLIAAALLVACALGGALLAASRCRALSCVSRGAGPPARCANDPAPQSLARLPLSDARELIIESFGVSRGESSVVLEVGLEGRFWNESDQNLYVFVGRTPPAAAPARYSLSSDEGYVADLPYAVRGGVELPHSNDLRVGVMAPREAAYTPQIYAGDAVRADAVGRDANISMEVNGHLVRLTLPLDELYRRRQAGPPERVSLTLATARDYVGFVDQLSVNDVAVGETKRADRRAGGPTLYPMLDYDSHRPGSVTLGGEEGSVRVEIETASEIRDWAQTNLHFFFVPYPPDNNNPAPRDPSKTVALPYPWSYYCGVYSPSRLFCKASNGSDFTYDEGYAERATLQAEGVRFRALGGARYVLELAPENADRMRAGRDAFAVLVTAGRDGFGPTYAYGWSLSRRCSVVRRLLGVAAPALFSQPACP